MYKKETLKNGLNIVTSHMPNMESASIGIWIGVGGRYEEKKICGMSHLVEHLLFKGTTSRSANVLKEAIEGVGGIFNGFTGEEVTCYYVKLPSRYMELGVDILSDMVLNPELNPQELEKEKFELEKQKSQFMETQQEKERDEEKAKDIKEKVDEVSSLAEDYIKKLKHKESS